MNAQPLVLCPVDFSDASLSALRYARLVAEHFGTRLMVLAVEDPLLTEAVGLGTGTGWDPGDTRRELETFAERGLGGDMPLSTKVDYEVAVGRPADEILRVAAEHSCELIVMSTHGLTGMRKLFFGSTTERVLRDTRVPVLATPPAFDGPRHPEDVRRTVRRVLVPVDLSEGSAHQVAVARGMAEALQLPLILAHVVEPVRSPLAARLHLPNVELERRSRAEEALTRMIASGKPVQAEALVAYGDPAEEIAKIARDRQAGLIVIGLHATPLLGPRMGSVTYRVLCLAHALVLALPPLHPEASQGQPPAASSFVYK